MPNNELHRPADRHKQHELDGITQLLCNYHNTATLFQAKPPQPRNRGLLGIYNDTSYYIREVITPRGGS